MAFTAIPNKPRKCGAARAAQSNPKRSECPTSQRQSDRYSEVIESAVLHSEPTSKAPALGSLSGVACHSSADGAIRAVAAKAACADRSNSRPGWYASVEDLGSGSTPTATSRFRLRIRSAEDCDCVDVRGQPVNSEAAVEVVMAIATARPHEHRSWGGQSSPHGRMRGTGC